MRRIKRIPLFIVLLLLCTAAILHVKPPEANAAAKYTFTVQCVCSDNAVSGAKFDVYLNGTKAASQVTRFSRSIDANTKYKITNIKTKSAYTYSGKKTLSGKITADKTVKLTLHKNPVITYNANGGTGTMSKLTVTYNKATALQKNAFKRKGYRFSGWAASKTGAVSYKNGASITTKTNKKLYAVWTPNTYKITFNGNGATSGSMTVQSMKFAASNALTANAFKRTGYTFAGWSTSKTGAVKYQDEAQYKCTGNKTLYAVWKPIKYTVQYNLDGGTFPNGNKTNFTESSDTTTWACNPTAIAYDCSNFTPKDGTAMAQNFRVKSPTKKGYTFKGWSITGLNASTAAFYLDGGWTKPGKTAADTGTMPKISPNARCLRTSSGTVTYTARWKINEYTFTFDANGGTGRVGSVTGQYNKNITLPGNAFTREGYDFTGWGTDREAASHQPGDEVVCTKNTTFYAIWKERPPVIQTYTVTFDGNGAESGAAEPVTANKGESIELPECVYVHNGYTFAGWSDAPENGSIYDAHTQYLSDTDTVLYAVWTPEEIQIPDEPVPVTFSVPSGAYNSQIRLELSNEYDLPIYYTLDGSDPTQASQVYDRKLNLNAYTSPRSLEEHSTEMYVAQYKYWPNNGNFPAACIVKAAVEMPDGTMGPVTTGTYFTGTDLVSRYNCTVISIVTDPDGLFDYDNGILVRGAIYDANADYNESVLENGIPWQVVANYTQKGKDWEREAVIQVFDLSNDVSFESPCGIRVRGVTSRMYAQRSFNVYFRKEYGQKIMEYDLIPGNCDRSGNPVISYKSFALRSGGNDTENMKFKDAALQYLASGLNIGTQASKPAILFLNGEYYGVFNLTEKFSDKYISSNYDVDSDNVVMFEEGELEEGTDEDCVLYNELCAFANTDLTVRENWEQFASVVDLDSMTDYYAAEIYIGNIDWGEQKNYRVWRSRTDDGTLYGDCKWRWILYDTEQSSGMYQIDLTSPQHNHIRDAMQNCPLFASAMQNDEFRMMFAEKMNNMANLYSGENVSNVFNQYYNIWNPYYNDYFMRFGGSYYDAVNNMNQTTDFFDNRAQYILGYVEEATTGLSIENSTDSE